MTYRELLEKLQKLNDEQLDCNITVCDTDEEYFSANGFNIADFSCQVLDEGHPYFVL